MSIKEFEARVGSVLVGNGEQETLVDDMNAFVYSTPEEKKRIDDLIRLVREYPMMKKINAFMAKMWKYMQTTFHEGFWVLSERLDYHALRAEYETVEEDWRIWVSVFGKNYSFTVLIAMRGVSAYGEQLAKIKF